MRQMNGLNSGFFLYARREMRLNLAFNTRNAQFFLLLRRVEVQITLHTPPSFTGCFPAECHPSQPCCTKKGAFLPLTCPPTLPFFACMPSFTPEYSQALPATARIRSEPGARFARKPGIQAHSSALEVPGEQLLCTAMTTSATALRRIFSALAVSLPNNVPPCTAVVQLPLPATAVSHEGNTPSYRSSQTAMVGFSASP